MQKAFFAAPGVLLLSLLSACSADPESPDVASEDALSQGPLAVVHIGDSISVGDFGTEIQKEYATDARFASRSFYAACGSRPNDWLAQANRTKHVETSCGYMERHPDGTRVDDPWQASGTPPHDIPFVQDILASTKPNLVVVELGLNMMGEPRADGTIDSHRLAVEVGQLKSAILVGAPAGSRACVWIAPNVAPHWSPAAQDAFYAMLTSTVGNDCLVIDGRPLTRAQDVGPDGVHVYGAGARRFADAAFAQIRDYVASHTTR